LRISNLNRLSTKFQKYADKEFIDKKSRATMSVKVLIYCLTDGRVYHLGD